MSDKGKKQPRTEQIWLSRLPKIAGVVFWGCLIVLCFLYRDRITVESIVNFLPENPFFTVGILLSLFAVKSITVVIHSGILCAVSGVLFSLPTAICVNLLGTAIMTTIPFLIGKKAGAKALDRLIQKHSKLELLRDISGRKEWFVSFFIRIIGWLPSDVVSAYLGASGLRYDRYITGTMAGLLPFVLSFSVMGESIYDISSPAFLISAGCEIGLTVLSILFLFVWRWKKKHSGECERGEKKVQKRI